MTRIEKTLALVAVFLWITLFAAGILINTTPYRNLITYRTWLAPDASPLEQRLAPTTPPDSSDRVLAWPIVLITYSVPNLLYLCILSSIAGAFLRRANKLGRGSSIGATLSGSALVGFLLYLSFIAGLVTIASANEFVAPNQDTYLRRAPVLSVICFMLTYQPSLLTLLLTRLSSFAESTISTIGVDHGRKPGDKDA